MATLAVEPKPTVTLSIAESMAKRLGKQASRESHFAKFLKTHPHSTSECEGRRLEIEDLDANCDGGPLEEYAGDLVGRDVHYELLPLMTWWTDLQDQAALEMIPDVGEEPEHEESLQAAIRTLNDLTASLGPALTANCRYYEQADWMCLVEALRRYRVWTRAVCVVVREAWPGIDWSDLEKLV